ncbi:MAG: hypothetical protein FJ146_11540 [Deltaproteobacteria bacterium]|nr:hypothetical protein [Deltaproteobacteria bacterium]
MKKILIAMLAIMPACGPKSGSQLAEAWNSDNDPTVISGNELVTKFRKLPLSGEVKMKGWSDSYWPTYTGGISVRWLTSDYGYDLIPETTKNARLEVLSPAEKYDVLLGRFDFPTVASERARTEIMKTVPGSPDYKEGFEIPGWYGLCHGWAPASQNFAEPQKPVEVALTNDNTVVFYPSDIKALLIYYQQYNGNRSTKTVFAGERCNEEFKKLEERLAAGEITRAEVDAAKETPECRDVNPGMLHLTLANEIGKKRLGLVMDRTRDSEVWNQPINSYQSRVVEEVAAATPGAAEGTVKELLVETAVYYTVETEPSTDPIGAVEQGALYKYWLELNKNGDVIGGRWVSEARPDFLYRETAPVFQGYFKRLEQIYKTSID